MMCVTRSGWIFYLTRWCDITYIWYFCIVTSLVSCLSFPFHAFWRFSFITQQCSRFWGLICIFSTEIYFGRVNIQYLFYNWFREYWTYCACCTNLLFWCDIVFFFCIVEIQSDIPEDDFGVWMLKYSILAFIMEILTFICGIIFWVYYCCFVYFRLLMYATGT